VRKLRAGSLRNWITREFIGARGVPRAVCMNADEAIFGAYFRSVSMCAPIERYFRVREQRTLDSRGIADIAISPFVRVCIKIIGRYLLNKHLLYEKGNKRSISLSISYNVCSRRPGSLTISSNSHSSIPSDFAIRISSVMNIRLEKL
jgi:hypothetical protein